MRKLFLLMLPTLAAGLAGCGELYKVRVHKPTDPSGIPFYSVSGACTQETVYVTPYFLVTLNIVGASGVQLSDSVKLSTAGHSSADFRALVGELSKSEPESGAVQTAWNLVKQRQSFDPYTADTGRFLLSNISKLSSTVDYSHQYSINQRKPLSGSANADYKLSSDGTLAEAQGQVQDDTLATILGALPLSDLIKSAAGITAAAGAAAAKPAQPAHFTLEQQERMIARTYSRTTAYTQNCPVPAAIAVNSQGAGMVLSDLGPKDLIGKVEAGKREDGADVGISGTISIPKALLPAKKDESPTTGQASSSTSPAEGGSAKKADKKKTSGGNKGGRKDASKKSGQ